MEQDSQLPSDAPIAKLCWYCKTFIRDEESFLYVPSTHKYYHKHHYTCFTCGNDMSESQSWHDGCNLYCYFCFNELKRQSSNICTTCNKPITNNYLECHGDKYHPECFKCCLCQAPLDKNSDVSRSLAGPACVTCGKNHKPRCSNCFLIINDDFYYKFQRFWHVECFKCKVCLKPVDPSEFMGHENWPVHVDCWKKTFARKCAHCGEIINSNFMKIWNFDVHVECSNDFVDNYYKKPVEVKSRDQEEFESLILNVNKTAYVGGSSNFTNDMTRDEGSSGSTSKKFVAQAGVNKKKKKKQRKSQPCMANGK